MCVCVCVCVCMVHFHYFSQDHGMRTLCNHNMNGCMGEIPLVIPHLDLTQEKEEHLLKQSICTKLTRLLCSHIQYIIKH